MLLPVLDSKLTIGLNNGLQTGEKIILLSDSADYPENIDPHKPYYVISLSTLQTADPKIQLASTKTDADNNNFITFLWRQ